VSALRLILGDQLSKEIATLKEGDRASDIIWMCEVMEEATYVRHHPKKIAFLFSAMRHFAEALKEDGWKVHYTTLDDEANAGSFSGEVERAIQTHHPEKLIVTHPGEYRVFEMMQNWSERFNIPVEIREDDRFFCALDDFNHWAKNRNPLRMEYFYREMRQKHAILMQGDKPEGGEWNYDAENRKPPKEGLDVPPPYTAQRDAITNQVLQLVTERLSDHFGDLEPFHFAVTRDQARYALRKFIDERLPYFGTYQDAMLQDEPWMYHSHLSFYMNCGLLSPRECVETAEHAYYNNNAPLNAVEGFIRQILGWREYVRGVYWLNMPEYASANHFHAQRRLPDFYWTGETRMNCMKQCITETKQHAYAHHIQRLMITGNFALIAGLDVREVNEWYLIVYADAYEWVEMPNVTGMILFADGGYLASKPYAAGGNYINKMSDYCKHCDYKVSEKTGEDACPFNYLYWDFIQRHAERLKSNPRVSMMVSTWERMDETKQRAITNSAASFFAKLTSHETV